MILSEIKNLWYDIKQVFYVILLFFRITLKHAAGMGMQYSRWQGGNEQDTRKGLYFRLKCFHKENNQSKEPLCYSEGIKTQQGHIPQVQHEMETENNKNIICFKIGKTIANRQKSSDGGKLAFDCMNESTWDLRHVKNRWSQYKRKGYDALIVLVVITKKEVPQDLEGINQEDYAVRCKQELIRIFKNDRRIRNKWGIGRKAQETPHAGIVYLAIKFGNADTPTCKIADSVDKAKDKMKSLVKEDRKVPSSIFFIVKHLKTKLEIMRKIKALKTDTVRTLNGLCLLHSLMIKY